MILLPLLYPSIYLSMISLAFGGKGAGVRFCPLIGRFDEIKCSLLFQRVDIYLSIHMLVSP